MSALVMTSCNISTFKSGIKGNGNMISKEIAIEDYNSISLGEIFDLVYTQDTNKNPYLRVEIDENLIDYVSITVNNNRLEVGISQDINPKHHKIYTNSTSLSEISSSGINNIELKDSIFSEDLRISGSGVGHIIGQNLHCQNINISMSGIADITLAGEVQNANMSVSGKGNINAYELKAQNADCSVSGMGHIEVYASKLLSAHVSGVGKIIYKGDPIEKKLSTSGIGSIKSAR